MTDMYSAPPRKPITSPCVNVAEKEGPEFSYADPADPLVKQWAIKAIERVTGQPRLKRLYMENRRKPVPGESFFDAAVRKLELKLNLRWDRLMQIPATGPVVIVSNHPYGVLDGIIVCHLVSQVRGDFKVLTNSVLYRAEEVRPYILPVDFAETDEALRTNLKTRREAQKLLVNGGCIVVFPSGGVGTAEKVLRRQVTIIDPEWKPFTARIIMASRATVVPIFFEGRNSRLFQFASKVSVTFRLSLFFKEVANKIGAAMEIQIGEPIPYVQLEHIKDRRVLMDHLRQITLALGSPVARHPKRSQQ
jgi:putative hemolysin